jgi:hypothetical protein
MAKVLFVGGSQGGSWLDVDDDQVKAVVPKLRVGFQSSVGDLGSETYIAHVLNDSAGASHRVFVAQDASAISILLECYERHARSI